MAKYKGRHAVPLTAMDATPDLEYRGRHVAKQSGPPPVSPEMAAVKVRYSPEVVLAYAPLPHLAYDERARKVREGKGIFLKPFPTK